jgi:hypothetical protein
VRCRLDAARDGASCGGTTVPTSITKKLDLAVAHAELAPSQSAKKAKRLAKSARHLLAVALKLVTRAAHGRHPKLSADCAADLVTAINEGSAALGAPAGSR